MRFGWSLDFRLSRGEFDRRVLEATAAIPYGAVTSYAHLASSIGKPTAARAVAQALRWNPVPLVVPCHRVVGSSGALVGYAGDKTDLKHRLLSVEGVRTRRTPRDYAIAREAMYACLEGEREYCLPSCSGLSATSLARLTLFGSRETAEACGLAPCTTCRPDLHPLPA
jgi:O-6-methylguanine DNA methyltransferase